VSFFPHATENRLDLGSIPLNLSKNIELNITAILQIIRLTRNDPGHPKGKRIEQEDWYQNLVIYANAHRKLHQLKDYFDEQVKSRKRKRTARR
jgi:hypothetical protein